MKIASFRYKDRDSFGIVADGQVSDCVTANGRGWKTLRDALSADDLKAMRAMSQSAPKYALDDVELLPVITDPGKIFCIGGNYADHIAEAVSVHSGGVTAKPIVFVRFPDTQIGAEAAILRPPESFQLDFEGELAVVIGKSGRRISADQALEYVAGYSIYNDATLRDYQLHTSQFTPGKNFPSTGAFGPWLVTADEIPDPSILDLSTRLNGEVVQKSSISKLIHDVPQLIAFLSVFSVLKPGDVIITGTPAGVGFFRSPQLWMKPGDVVEVEISGIGVLRNPVADE